MVGSGWFVTTRISLQRKLRSVLVGSLQHELVCRENLLAEKNWFVTARITLLRNFACREKLRSVLIGSLQHELV